MAFHMLATYSWSQFVMAAVMIGVCLLLMLIILLQKGRGEGLAGAFGGGGGSSAFGAKTGDVFTWITVGLAVVFIFLSVVANFVFDESAVASPSITAISADEVPATPAEDSAAPKVLNAKLVPPTPVTIPSTKVVIPEEGSGADADAVEKTGDEAPVEDTADGDSPEADDKESPPNP